MSVDIIARKWETPVSSKGAKRAAYSASWGSIVQMLRGELRQIGARSVIIEMDVDEYDLRNDGWIRSNARPASPGVRLTFQSRHGELCYECGTWANWEHNVYAIARTLRSQRMIARDGAVKGDQVYRGFKRLPSAIPMPGSQWSTVEDAERYIRTVGNAPPGMTLEEAYRHAARKSHPDVGGSEKAMADLNAAKDFIDKHAGVPA